MKIYNYTILMLILMVLLNMFGFGFASQSYAATNFGIFNLPNITGFAFWTTMISMFGLVGLSSAIIGTVFGIPWTFILKGTYIMGTLANFVMDIVAILGQLTPNSWVFYTIGIVLIPMAGAYAIALIEFWDGRD